MTYFFSNTQNQVKHLLLSQFKIMNFCSNTQPFNLTTLNNCDANVDFLTEMQKNEFLMMKM